MPDARLMVDVVRASIGGELAFMNQPSFEALAEPSQ
jgi:hypothetical protein